MKTPIENSLVRSVLEDMAIADAGKATIRQVVAVANRLQQASGEPFIHLEMGVPALPPARVGIEAEREALTTGIASIYPDMSGIAPLKQEAARFVKAFLDVDVKPEGCIPTVGSMMGSLASFILCSQLDPKKDTILFIDPGFSVQRSQVNVLGYKSVSFDIYDYRADKLRDKLEGYLSAGNVCAIVYSTPNNPAWICLTEGELQTIGELATKYDTVVIEDLAYLCMDFRSDLGSPFQPPYQPSVARYTENYILLVSASKIFSYAGQRIAVAVISDALFHRPYPALEARYNIPEMGPAFILAILYTLSSGVTHSTQYALAAMFRAASDGEFDFVEQTREYGRRAARLKEIFIRHGFTVVYDKDIDQPVGDGFFFTVGYPGLTGSELLYELLHYGVSAIVLSTCGSLQEGLRACTSQIRDEQYDLLDRRLALFAENHKK